MLSVSFFTNKYHIIKRIVLFWSLTNIKKNMFIKIVTVVYEL